MDSTLCDSNTNKQWKLFLANGLSKKNYTLFLCAGIFWRTQSRKNTLLKTLDFWNFTMGMGLFFNPSNLILTFFSFKAVFIWSWPFFFYWKTPPFDNFFLFPVDVSIYFVFFAVYYSYWAIERIVPFTWSWLSFIPLEERFGTNGDILGWNGSTKKA